MSKIFDRIKESMDVTEYEKGTEYAEIWVEKKADFNEFKKIGEGNYATTIGTPNIPFLEDKDREFKKGFAKKVKELWWQFKKQEKK